MNKTIEVLEKRQKYLKQRIDLGNWGIGREKLSLKKEYKTELNALSTAIQAWNKRTPYNSPVHEVDEYYIDEDKK